MSKIDRKIHWRCLDLRFEKDALLLKEGQKVIIPIEESVE